MSYKMNNSLTQRHSNLYNDPHPFMVYRDGSLVVNNATAKQYCVYLDLNETFDPFNEQDSSSDKVKSYNLFKFSRMLVSGDVTAVELAHSKPSSPNDPLIERYMSVVRGLLINSATIASYMGQIKTRIALVSQPNDAFYVIKAYDTHFMIKLLSQMIACRNMLLYNKYLTVGDCDSTRQHIYDFYKDGDVPYRALSLLNLVRLEYVALKAIYDRLACKGHILPDTWELKQEIRRFFREQLLHDRPALQQPVTSAATAAWERISDLKKEGRFTQCLIDAGCSEEYASLLVNSKRFNPHHDHPLAEGYLLVKNKGKVKNNES